MLNLLAYTSSSLGKLVEKYILLLLIILIIQVLIIRACVKTANNKGYSGFGWGLAAFFFSLLALIILLCIPDLTISYNLPTWICTKCGHIHYEDASKCSVCKKERIVENTSTHEDLQPKNSTTTTQTQTKPKTQKPSTIPETPKAKTWTCPKCGEENNINAKNCINCFAEKP